MKLLKLIYLPVLVLFLSINAHAGDGLMAGDSVSSTSSEAKEVSEKIRQQIQELSKGILHGAPQFSMVGILELSGGSYMINGDSFIVNDNTVIFGELKPGAYVEVRGNLIKDKPKVAKQVTVAEPDTSAFSGTKSKVKKSSEFNPDDYR